MKPTERARKSNHRTPDNAGPPTPLNNKEKKKKHLHPTKHRQKPPKAHQASTPQTTNHPDTPASKAPTPHPPTHTQHAKKAHRHAAKTRAQPPPHHSPHLKPTQYPRGPPPPPRPPEKTPPPTRQTMPKTPLIQGSRPNGLKTAFALIQKGEKTLNARKRSYYRSEPKGREKKKTKRAWGHRWNLPQQEREIK